MRTGLVFGKFYPLHTGHEALINFASQNCDELLILACASEQEIIPAAERASWLKKTFSHNPKIVVRSLEYSESELPNSSVSSREVSAIWASHFLMMLPKIDVVFTAEDYGDYLAEIMKIEHLRYTAAKNISATLIRNSLVKKWDFVNIAAREHLTKKVVILGTESVGKSTLTSYLAKYFETAMVSEAGRELISSSEKCSLADLQLVATHHASSIKQKLAHARRVLFMDTDINITRSYARFLFKSELTVSQEIEQINKADLYLYLDKDAPYVQDGTRLDIQDRDLLDLSHRQVLAEKGIRYELLSGSWQSKYAQAISLAERILPFGGQKQANSLGKLGLAA